MDKPLMLVIKDTYRLWAGYMRSLAASAGVPDSFRMILTYLLRHPGANQKYLAAHCGITTASVSQTVKEMQMMGYVRKEPDERDQRCVRLYLTQKGETCAAEIRQKIKQADQRISTLLTREREEQVLALMAQLSEIIEKELP